MNHLFKHPHCMRRSLISIFFESFADLSLRMVQKRLIIASLPFRYTEIHVGKKNEKKNLLFRGKRPPSCGECQLECWSREWYLPRVHYGIFDEILSWFQSYLKAIYLLLRNYLDSPNIWGRSAIYHTTLWNGKGSDNLFS